MKMNISLPVEIDIPDCVIEEIRNKAIDDFAIYMSNYIDNNGACDLIDRPYTRMAEIAERLKGGGVNE